MNKNFKNIEPQKINKPIQLLAAWLAGLVLVNGSFLSAAVIIKHPEWAAGYLVVISSLNVLVFLAAIFLLQTKFRPEMQEDSYYHEYLISKDGRSKNAEVEVEVEVPEGQNGIWSKNNIRLNQSIKDSARIEELLQVRDIPVSSYFGGVGSRSPSGRVVSFGRGFDSEQIKKIIFALSKSSINYVDYAADEESVDEYNDQLLIGSYTANHKTHTLPMKVAVSIINRDDYSAKKFYSEIIMAHESGYEA